MKQIEIKFKPPVAILGASFTKVTHENKKDICKQGTVLFVMENGEQTGYFRILPKVDGSLYVMITGEHPKDPTYIIFTGYSGWNKSQKDIANAINIMINMGWLYHDPEYPKMKWKVMTPTGKLNNLYRKYGKRPVKYNKKLL